MLPTKPDTVVTVTVALEVNDAAKLYAAAKERAFENDCDEEDIEEMLGTAEEPNLSACCQWLIDPGTSPAGTTILYSEVE